MTTSHCVPNNANDHQFFGSAFLSFMAVAYVPSYLEDYATFIKERANGLYGATAFMLSNFFIGLPYLCMLSKLTCSSQRN